MWAAVIRLPHPTLPEHAWFGLSRTNRPGRDKLGVPGLVRSGMLPIQVCNGLSSLYRALFGLNFFGDSWLMAYRSSC